MTLEQLLDLHGELCSDTGRPSQEWLRRWRQYHAARKALEDREVRTVRFTPTAVARAVMERFGTWIPPDERAALLAYDFNPEIEVPALTPPASPE